MPLSLRKIFKIASYKERKIVLTNVVSLATLQGINYVLPIIVLPYLIRVLGPERFGLLAFAQAFAQYFVILNDYGFSVSATREISLCRNEPDKVCSIFSSVITVKIIFGILSFLILLATISFIPKFSKDWLVYLFSFGTVIGNSFFPVWFFQGKEKMQYIAGLNILSGVLSTISLFILVNDPNDYLYVPLITSIAALITGLLGLYIVYRKFSIGFVIQTYTDIQQQLRAGWNVFVSIVAINTYTATRIFAVGLLTNNTVTGYYAIAERIAGIIQSFPLMSFSQAVYPRLSKIYLQNKRRAMRIMYHVQRITTVTYIVLGFPLFFITAPWLIRLICGIEYPDVVMAMRLLLLSIFFITGNAFRVQFLLVSGRAKLFARIHVIMAALSLGLLFLLTYVFSYRGTAYSAIITEAGIFLLTWKAMKELAEL